MKTLTEFNAFDLTPSIKTLQELTSAGKTPEEIQAAFTESKKLEGDKLKFFLHALELIKDKSSGLKRVLVFTAAETEKVPAGSQKHEEHYYLVEFFPAQQSQRPPREGGRYGDKKGGRGGKGGGRGGKPGGDRGGRDSRDGGGRPARGPGRPQDGASAGAAPGGPGAPSGENRGPRGPRAPRPPRAFQAPRPRLGPDGQPLPPPALPKPLDKPIGAPVSVTPKPAPAAESSSAPTSNDSNS